MQPHQRRADDLDELGVASMESSKGSRRSTATNWTRICAPTGGLELEEAEADGEELHVRPPI
jgi:hypothetical protein